MKDFAIESGSAHVLKLEQSRGPQGLVPIYTFYVYVYPWVPSVGISTLPAYVISGLPNSIGNELPTHAYDEMNRAAAPNTSLFFVLNLPEYLAPDLKWIEDNIRVVLVEMPTRDEDQAFAPLRVSADMPQGM